MSLTDILGVAIALSVVYLLVASVCSGIVELIAQVARKRARFLRYAIWLMLGEKIRPHDCTKPNRRATEMFFDSPILAPYFTSLTRCGKRKWRASYLAPGVFSGILLSLHRQIPSDDRAKEEEGRRLAEILDGLGADPHNDQEEAVSRIAEWFAASMDGLSEYYKRWTRWMLFIVGLALALAVNIDTVLIARALAEDPGLQVKAAAVADSLTLSATALPASSTGATTDTAVIEISGTALGPVEGLSELDKLGLPIGWPIGGTGIDDPRVPDDPLGWLLKAIGLLITAVAISFGAPFWFDVLSKLTPIRSAGKLTDVGTGGADSDGGGDKSGTSAPSQPTKSSESAAAQLGCIGRLGRWFRG